MAGQFFEDLRIGQSASFVRTVTEADVMAFAAVSGDDNPVHLDEAFAAGTPFKTRIAHGMLSASFISALLGVHLPGPGAIYLSQTLQFRRPVRLGASVEARVEITALDEAKGRVTLACACSVDGKRVLDGEAVVLAPKRNGG
ncbi:MAG: MaoC family dehydratase [Alphaproteobacteria bacterium]|jgi:3-hydroxybutyryl-CoA dehydratase|nr:MaoC family dehydratase [Alphaproteobacteria bacterium]